MKIPSRNIGVWSSEIIAACSVSLVDRIQRGAVYRALFLTGDENGSPQTYNKSNPFIEKSSSNLYSPVDLRFTISPPKDAGADEWAKAKRAAAELNTQIAGADIDLILAEAFDWSLIKGKVFMKLLWDRRECEIGPYLLQPEFMGVLREDLPTLDRQEAFFQSSYITLHEFDRRVAGRDDAKELMRKVRNYAKPGKSGEGPDRDTILKQVIIGGTNPFQISGQATQNSARGVVNWLAGPAPVWDAKTLANIVRFDELWVWDTDRSDWTTIQLVGPDCVVEGKGVHRNIFADDVTTDPDEKNSNNPLEGHHPFLEICVNPLNGYFWGRSELVNVGLAQKTLNARVDGINRLLRKQEDPPTFYKGLSINAELAQRLKQPGGWLSDNAPNGDVKNMAPEIPAGLYESMHESLGIFQEMADEPPVMQGKGESGVRSQAHAETLVRTASPRLKRKALRAEKEVAKVGSLAFGILRAHDPDKYTAWVPGKEAGIQASLPPSNPLEQPPSPQMKSIEFTLNQVHEKSRVQVDSHSSSPIFAGETRDLILGLVKMGAISAARALELLHPPDEDELVSEAERRDFEQAEAQAEALKQGGPAALHAISGGKKK